MAMIWASRAVSGVRLKANENRKAKTNDYSVEGGEKSVNPNGFVTVPRLSLNKPSWVVKTESNIRKETRKVPDPRCVVCNGTGRVDCFHCSAKGRTNCVDLAMLPKGEWPKWCTTCGGSGLDYCSRCLGTGEYRYIMGFHFMKKDNDDLQHLPKPGPHPAADQLLNGDHYTS